MVFMEQKDEGEVERKRSASGKNGDEEVINTNLAATTTNTTTTTNGTLEEVSSPSSEAQDATTTTSSNKIAHVINGHQLDEPNEVMNNNNNNENEDGVDDDGGGGDPLDDQASSSDDSTISVIEAANNNSSTSTSCDVDGVVGEDDGALGSSETLKPLLAMFRHPALAPKRVEKLTEKLEELGVGKKNHHVKARKEAIQKSVESEPPLMIMIPTEGSVPFEEKRIELDHPVKVGRAVAKTTTDNAIFKCKVLSRNHALLWYEDGKFYVKDTNSSNGTFVNGTKLHSSADVGPVEIYTKDILQFGLEVTERDKVHQCVIAQIRLFMPNGTEARSRSQSWGYEAYVPKPTLPHIDPTLHVSSQMLKLARLLQCAQDKQAMMESQLDRMRKELEKTKQTAGKSFTTLVKEEQLLSRVEALQSKVQTLMVVADENNDESTLQVKIQLLKEQLLNMIEDKENLEQHCKARLQKVLEDKVEALARVKEIEEKLAIKVDDCARLLETNEKKVRELHDLAACCNLVKEERDVLEQRIKQLEKEWPAKLIEMDRNRMHLETQLDRLKLTLEINEKHRSKSKYEDFDDPLVVLQHLRSLEKRRLQMLSADQRESMWDGMIEVLKKIPDEKATDDEGCGEKSQQQSSRHRKLEKILMNGKGAVRIKATSDAFSTDLLQKLMNLDESLPPSQTQAKADGETEESTEKLTIESVKSTASIEESSKSISEHNDTFEVNKNHDEVRSSDDFSKLIKESRLEVLNELSKISEPVTVEERQNQQEQRFNPFDPNEIENCSEKTDDVENEANIMQIVNEILEEKLRIVIEKEELNSNLNQSSNEEVKEDLLIKEENEEIEHLDLLVESEVVGVPQVDSKQEMESPESAYFDVDDDRDEDGDVKIVDDYVNDVQKQVERSLDELEEELDLELLDSADQATQVEWFDDERPALPIASSSSLDLDGLRNAVRRLELACHSPEPANSTDGSVESNNAPCESDSDLIETLHQLTRRVAHNQENHVAELAAIRAEINALTYQNQLSFAMATFPLMLIFVAIIAAFYPILSFLMGTSDR